MRQLLILSAFICLIPAVSAQNKKISNGSVFDGEPYISVNPTQSHHMVVAWMGFVPFQRIAIKTTVSFDAGKTWSTPVVIPHENSQFGSADPSLEFDDNGNVFLSYIDFSKAIDSGAIYTRKSIDGGLSWERAVKVIDMHAEANKLAIDRPWIAVDRSNGPYSSHLYVTSMNADGALPPFHPYLTVSPDTGNTYNNWKHLDAAPFLVGSTIPKPMPAPAVSSDGTFHAVYPSFMTSQSILPRYLHVSSTDGGGSFSYHNVISSSITFNDSLAKKGYLLRTNPADANHLAFFLLYSPFGDADVYIIESFDAGVNWSAPKRVNDDPQGNNRMQDLVWADFDQDGDLIVAWRDRRNGSNATYLTESEIWAAFRNKDSVNFSANFQISDRKVPFDSILMESGNDFMSIQLADDTLSAVWGDTRTGVLSIWFQRMTTDGDLVGLQQLNKDDGIVVFPNPVLDMLTIQGNEISRLELFDSRGELLLESSYGGDNKAELSLTNQEVGIYFLRVIDVKGERIFRVVKTTNQ